jgi:GYF domain 2
MSDIWYYADRNGQHGPLSLKELLQILKELGSSKDLLVWSDGFSDWKNPENVAELKATTIAPPPLPTGHGSEICADSARANATLEHRIVVLVVFYTLIALSLAIFVQMQEPLANWENLINPFKLGQIVSFASLTLVVSGFIPFFMWAFRRFQLKKTTAPFATWLVLLLAQCGVVGFAAQQKAAAFCLADDELKELLIGTTVPTLGAVLETCISRFPELTDRGRKAFTALTVTYANDIRGNHRVTAAMFQKEGRNMSMRDEVYRNAASQAAQKASGYSDVQCRKTIGGFEAMAVAQNFAVIEAPAKISFNAERSRIPRC